MDSNLPGEIKRFSGMLEITIEYKIQLSLLKTPSRHKSMIFLV
jgi:hypothetical protein